MQSFDTEIVIPEPSRLLEGLRDTGYDFNTAVADIVDNSIAADAEHVRITASRTADQGIRFSVADDGIGMDRDGLISAMKYGAPAREGKHSLGKFGLGLKTASTSCCRRLKVISRNEANAQPLCAVWDLDYIATEGNWVLRFEDTTVDDDEEFFACAEEASGTLVVWEKCDRLLSARYSNPNSAAFQRAFERSLVVLRQHLAMVYQRFLDKNDNRARNVEITLNGELVEPWDPFCKELGPDYGTKYYSITAEDSDGAVVSSNVKVTAYIVPAKQELATDAEKSRVMPSYGNDDLKAYSEESLGGFYIYRENRLIHWGDWFNLPGVDFHNKLCRFELSFDEELDDVFQVDIKKSRILLNDELREAIFEFAGPIKNEGNRRYRGNERKVISKTSKGLHEDANAQLAKSQQGTRVKSSLGTDNSGNPTISNRFGTTAVPYEIIENEGEHPVKVEESLEDGLLWMPAFIGDQHGVLLNSNHPFYQRFYGINKENSSAVQGMDSVFLAFAQAETTAWQPEAKENLEEARYEASRILRKYADALPDVATEDFEDEK
ncbi:ATP-binding protein [uncultured Slackia sp.]|uniref:ATP-binding protein n=1 Tax=uncultured Slackia sp. TaxID=665903 RepID=UPI0026E039AA|nr:ATP-binding protein [uncultured Slackia sp.]